MQSSCANERRVVRHMRFPFVLCASIVIRTSHTLRWLAGWAIYIFHSIYTSYFIYAIYMILCCSGSGCVVCTVCCWWQMMNVADDARGPVESMRWISPFNYPGIGAGQRHRSDSPVRNFAFGPLIVIIAAREREWVTSVWIIRLYYTTEYVVWVFVLLAAWMDGSGLDEWESDG